MVLELSVNLGSSPLTRGKLGHPAHAHRPPGLIPAHAGKTSSLSWYHLSQRAHPRSRGENLGLPPPGWPVGGSSPLTRGKPTHHDAKAANHRAHPRSRGENTWFSEPQGIEPRAHPRSRGENFVAAMYGRGLRGSSPLTRGKRGDAPACPAFLGLIPAHAGKTRSRACLGKSGWAHPRSRGENLNAPLVKLPRTGSSPLTRGKPLRVCEARKHQGLIPAHAGKTAGHRVPSCSIAAHPRSRGENRPCDSHSAAIAGSSPLTRGKRPGWARRGRACGLIPAHAGKTIGPDSAVNGAVAHPRSRGENFGQKTNDPGAKGSSPLTRGKHRLPGRGHHRHGLIPAHAGKTTFSSASHQ